MIEDTSLNLAYMWFLGINPDEDLPDPSLLAKFRVHKLKDITSDEIITEIVNQCVKKGIIKDTGISIDATHTEANTFKATPERVMKRLAKKIFNHIVNFFSGLNLSPCPYFSSHCSNNPSKNLLTIIFPPILFFPFI